MNELQSLSPTLDRVHAWAHRQPWLRRFTVVNRLLLAMAFLPTGLVKATGQRFTILPIDNPIGFFFEAMYRTGPYWYFIGIMQVLAAVLLLIPATSTLGALVFLPIGISVFLVTWGVGFGNTVYITAGMLLSAIYLVCWDGDRIWDAASRLWGQREGGRIFENMHGVERAGWLVGATAGMGLVLTTRGYVPFSLVRELFFAGLAGAILVLAGWILGARATPSSLDSDPQTPGSS